MSTNKEKWEYQDFSYDDFSYDDFSYADYKASQAVRDALSKSTSAENALKTYSNFTYGKQADLDSILNQYLNREKFSYDFNSDALYQQYRDKYIKQGKLAMADTMGQAAAMTGGYGNSYAASAGNQAYQASLENLNDIVPELYAMALDRYNQQGQDLANQYSMLSDDRNAAYSQWQDGYNRLASDRDYYANRYDSERQWDYGMYSDDRDFAYSQYSADRNLDYDMYSSDRNLAYDEYATDKNLSYQEYRDAIADEQWQTEYDENLRRYEESKATNNTSNPTVKPDDTTPENDTVEPTKTKAVSNFIAYNRTSSEWLRQNRNKTAADYKNFIKEQIDKDSSLTDAEIAYLVLHYGLAN